ncbi:MAG TPA: hypothetical protein VND22_01675 [Actinomycetota bacterium]|nr:hypothetical protein [Actinomycetota bacterium]
MVRPVQSVEFADLDAVRLPATKDTQNPFRLQIMIDRLQGLPVPADTMNFVAAGDFELG